MTRNLDFEGRNNGYLLAEGQPGEEWNPQREKKVYLCACVCAYARVFGYVSFTGLRWDNGRTL